MIDEYIIEIFPGTEADSSHALRRTVECDVAEPGREYIQGLFPQENSVYLADETAGHHLTASVGLVTRSDTISTTEEFVQMAIEAMYRDKVKKENKLQIENTTLTEGVTT